MSVCFRTGSESCPWDVLRLAFGAGLAVGLFRGRMTAAWAEFRSWRQVFAAVCALCHNNLLVAAKGAEPGIRRDGFFAFLALAVRSLGCRA